MMYTMHRKCQLTDYLSYAESGLRVSTSIALAPSRGSIEDRRLIMEKTTP